MSFFFVRKTSLLKKRAEFLVVFVIKAQSSGSQWKTVKKTKSKLTLKIDFREN